MQRCIAFQKAVELGNITRAAEALGYTQPAVSQMIASLEKELGLKLLYRSRHGIHLTIEGEKIFPALQGAVAHYLALQEMAREIRGLESGVIRVGTFSSISCHWLPRLIREFQDKYPNVQFVLHQGDYTTIPEWVRTGEADFGFVNPDALPNTRTIFLKSDEMRAVVPEGHPLAQKECVTLAELAQEPFLLLEEGVLSEPMAVFEKEGLRPDVRLCVHDDYSILSMVECGLGVSILPELVLRKTAYRVAVRPLKPCVTRKIALVTKAQNAMPLAAKKFVDFLLERLDELP